MAEDAGLDPDPFRSATLSRRARHPDRFILLKKTATQKNLVLGLTRCITEDTGSSILLTHRAVMLGFAVKFADTALILLFLVTFFLHDNITNVTVQNSVYYWWPYWESNPECLPHG